MDTERPVLCGLVLLDSHGAAAWPQIFQMVKSLMQTNQLHDDLRSGLKGWIKGSDTTLTLLALSVLSTIVLNASASMRQQLAGPRWFERLEKQLLKPQNGWIAAALAQVIMDWALLFTNEDLGVKSRGLASHHKLRHLFEGLGLSSAAQDVVEEMSMGLPLVGPRRGIDFIAARAKAQASSSTPLTASAAGGSLSGGSTTSGGGSAPAAGWTGAAASASSSTLLSSSSSAAAGRTGSAAGAAAGATGAPAAAAAYGGGCNPLLLGGDDVPPLIPDSAMIGSSVAAMVQRMASDAAQLLALTQQAIDATRAASGGTSSSSGVAAASGRSAATRIASSSTGRRLMTALDKGFIAAERCGGWRGRVQGLAQTIQDSHGVSQLLESLDGINTALQAWQSLTCHQLFATLRVPVHLGRWQQPDNQQQQAGSPQRVKGKGGGVDLAGLFAHTTSLATTSASSTTSTSTAGARASSTLAAAGATSISAPAGGFGGGSSSAAWRAAEPSKPQASHCLLDAPMPMPSYPMAASGGGGTLYPAIEPAATAAAAPAVHAQAPTRQQQQPGAGSAAAAGGSFDAAFDLLAASPPASRLGSCSFAAPPLAPAPAVALAVPVAAGPTGGRGAHGGSSNSNGFVTQSSLQAQPAGPAPLNPFAPITQAGAQAMAGPWGPSSGQSGAGIQQQQTPWPAAPAAAAAAAALAPTAPAAKFSPLAAGVLQPAATATAAGAGAAAGSSPLTTGQPKQQHPVQAPPPQLQQQQLSSPFAGFTGGDGRPALSLSFNQLPTISEQAGAHAGLSTAADSSYRFTASSGGGSSVAAYAGRGSMAGRGTSSSNGAAALMAAAEGAAAAAKQTDWLAEFDRLVVSHGSCPPGSSSSGSSAPAPATAAVTAGDASQGAAQRTSSPQAGGPLALPSAAGVTGGPGLGAASQTPFMPQLRQLLVQMDQHYRDALKQQQQAYEQQIKDIKHKAVQRIKEVMQQPPQPHQHQQPTSRGHCTAPFAGNTGNSGPRAPMAQLPIMSCPGAAAMSNAIAVGAPAQWSVDFSVYAAQPQADLL